MMTTNRERICDAEVKLVDALELLEKLTNRMPNRWLATLACLDMVISDVINQRGVIINEDNR